MLPLHIALYSVQSIALACAVTEVGLSAYEAFEISVYRHEDELSYYGELVSPFVDFVLFAGSWTIIFAAVAMLLPCLYGRKGEVSITLNRTLGIIFSIVYFFTMVFWLACVGRLANLGLDSIFGPMLGLAVLLWLMYIALFILSILALCGVVHSDWAGYKSLRQPRGDTEVAQGYGMPMHEQLAPQHFSPHYNPPQYQGNNQHKVSHSDLSSALGYSGVSVHDHTPGHV